MQEIKAVRVICDNLLKDKILKKILGFGATGYTWWEVHGKGRKEMLPVGTICGGLDRIYIEVWCNDAVATKIVRHCDSDQYRSHGVTVGMEPLLVSDEEIKKFTGEK